MRMCVRMDVCEDGWLRGWVVKRMGGYEGVVRKVVVMRVVVTKIGGYEGGGYKGGDYKGGGYEGVFRRLVVMRVGEECS